MIEHALTQLCGITMIPVGHSPDISVENEMPCYKQSREMFHGLRNLKFLAVMYRTY